MKTLLFLGAFLLSAYSPAAPADSAKPAQRCIIGISPFLQAAEKDAVFRRIAGFLLEDAPLGSSLWLYDAYHLRTIAQMDIPDVRAFRSSKTRANQFKKHIGGLRDFLARDHPKPEAQHLDFERAIRLPQFMDFVADNLLGPTNEVAVVLLGSPLYVDPKEPSFSMIAGAFPSDGHLLASRDQSVYGLKSREGALKNTRVHLCWFGDPWVSEIHREKIGRFWSVYLAMQGAALGTFCGDLPTAFNALRSSTPALARHELDRSSSKIEMLRISREVAESDWITREVIANAATAPPSVTAGPMKIGIRWKGNIDLDLYATPASGAQTLFFEHTRSPEGYYFKDHRSSPEREFEFIEFEQPVNVYDVRARINFFEGRVPNGPAGEARVEFAGRIYTGRFNLAARHGNEGREGSGQEAFWFDLDLQEILKLRDGAPVARAAR